MVSEVIGLDVSGPVLIVVGGGATEFDNAGKVVGVEVISLVIGDIVDGREALSLLVRSGCVFVIDVAIALDVWVGNIRLVFDSVDVEGVVCSGEMGSAVEGTGVDSDSGEA